MLLLLLLLLRDSSLALYSLIWNELVCICLSSKRVSWWSAALGQSSE